MNKMVSRPVEEKILCDLLQPGRYLNARLLRTCPPNPSTGMKRFEWILAVGQICIGNKQTHRESVHYSKILNKVPVTINTAHTSQLGCTLSHTLLVKHIQHVNSRTVCGFAKVYVCFCMSVHAWMNECVCVLCVLCAFVCVHGCMCVHVCVYVHVCWWVGACVNTCV